MKTEHEEEILLSKDFFDDGKLPLCVFRMPFYRGDRLSHSHEFYEIMIVIGGTSMHTISGKTQTIVMGDVFFIPPGLKHSFKVGENGGIQVLNILFGDELFRANLRDLTSMQSYRRLCEGDSLIPSRYAHIRLSAKELARVNSLAEQIEVEQEDISPGYQLLCEIKLREILVILMRRLSHVQGRSNNNIHKIREALLFIEENLDQPLDFSHIAEIAHMSPTSLRRAFHDAFDCSPMSYVKRLRIQKAMLLLNDPGRNITDVAFDVGFSDSGHFARVFKIETGQTPSAFRKQFN